MGCPARKKKVRTTQSRRLANEAVLSRQLIMAQESERRHVARELHDEICQVLTAVSLKLHHLKEVCGSEAASDLDGGVDLIDQAMTQVRNLSLNLRPPMLDVLGLDAAVRSCVEQHRQQTGCDVQLNLQLEARLSPDLEITCYRVIQNALTNVARHAHASQVSVDIRQNDLELEVFVRDNGIGLDLASVRQRLDQGQSFGILAMQERVQLMGGTFRIDSGSWHVGSRSLPVGDAGGGSVVIPMASIRLMLADDHALVRAGLRALLEKFPGVVVVGEAADGRDALRQIETLVPDVVLMDVMMPEMNGLEATARAVNQFPNTRIVILSMNSGQEFIMQALQAGARGYLLKNINPAELETAINVVARGGTFLCSAIPQHVVDECLSNHGGPASSLQKLSQRQREVLQLIAEGNSIKSIGAKLGIAAKTAETHRADLMKALSINDVAGLTRYAIRMGLISPDA